jgi:hypothetical protein
MEEILLGKSKTPTNLETKRPEVFQLSDNEITDLKIKWEERNFMDVNVWCQMCKCKLDIDVTELEAQKKFLTKVTILDDQNQLSQNIMVEGIGPNKKESKTQAMRALMNRLIETNNIHLGLKKPKERSNSVKGEKNISINQTTIINITSTQNETIPTKDRFTAIVNSKDSVEKKVSKTHKLMLINLKDGLLDEGLRCLKQILRWKKILDWLDISYMLLSFLETKNLDLIYNFLDYLKDENFEEHVEVVLYN